MQMLNSLPNEIILSRGFDVIQTESENDFVEYENIADQRSLAIPNSALCKPHISKIPISYSGGYHYCNKKLKFADSDSGFLTLHMKWACRKIRRSLAEIVEHTTYNDKIIENYSRRTVSENVSHPALELAKTRPVENINSTAVKDFELTYLNNLCYSGETGLWTGPHFVADFFIYI